MSALEHFRTVLFEDAALRESLWAIEDAEQFIGRAVEAAHARAIALDRADLEFLFRPDPLALERFSRARATAPPSPQKNWLPVALLQQAEGPTIDWAYFGSRGLTDSFYEVSMRRALCLPFNRLCGFRTRLEDLAAWAQGMAHLQPSGFIFHMSRCGSTLTAQMLASLPSNIVVSEAPPLDAVLQSALGEPAHVPLLKAMLDVFGQIRSGREKYFIAKLDSWHALALPLLRQIFPSVPWIFLYRDPAEVMVSQHRQRGIQMVPEFVDPALYGIELADGAPTEDYWARVLNSICRAALREYGKGGGLLVNYSQLPDALWTHVLPHFGIACTDAEREVMARAARRDAKAPQMEYSSDCEAKQKAVTAAIRAACERHLKETYLQLESLRLSHA